MENTRLLRKSLWANVVFAEMGALAAFFFNDQWVAIRDLTNGQGLAFGIELLMVAGLVTYVAFKRNPGKLLLISVISANALLFIYLVSRLFDASISAMGAELIVVATVTTLALLICQSLGLRAFHAKQEGRLAS